MCCYYVRWMLSVWYMTWIPFFLSLVHLNSMSNRQSKMTDNLKNTFTGTLCYVVVCCKLKGHGHVDKDVWKKFGRVKGSWMHPYLMQICVLTTLLLRSFVTEDFVASFHPLSFPPPPHALHTCRKVWPHKFFEGITLMNSVNFGSHSYICVMDMGKCTFKHILLFILVLSAKIKY